MRLNRALAGFVLHPSLMISDADLKKNIRSYTYELEFVKTVLVKSSQKQTLFLFRCFYHRGKNIVLQRNFYLSKLSTSTVLYYRRIFRSFATLQTSEKLSILKGGGKFPASVNMMEKVAPSMPISILYKTGL